MCIRDRNFIVAIAVAAAVNWPCSCWCQLLNDLTKFCLFICLLVCLFFFQNQVGPYLPRRRLSLGDHVLVGRTGFSVNRFDYGVSERMGARWVLGSRAAGSSLCVCTCVLYSRPRVIHTACIHHTSFCSNTSMKRNGKCKLYDFHCYV